MQGNPSVFYQSFLELDRRNMVSILAFDSKTIKFLLKDDYSEGFSSEFPVFYTNRHQKNHKLKQNAIDVAIQNNQIRAVNLIIDHIIKYQNNFVSSYLFEENLIDIMNRGISVVDLMKSNVFSFKFEYEEWPQVHTDLTKIINPYNGSIFSLREKYGEIFPALGESKEAGNSNKVASVGDSGVVEEKDDGGADEIFYKITYTVNLLSSVGPQGEGESLCQMFQTMGEDDNGNGL